MDFFNYVGYYDIVRNYQLQLKEPKQVGTCVLMRHGDYISIERNDAKYILISRNPYSGCIYAVDRYDLESILTIPERYLAGRHPVAEASAVILPLPINDELQECLHPYSWLPERIGDFKVTINQRSILLENGRFRIILCADYCVINNYCSYDGRMMRVPYTDTFVFYQIDEFLRLVISAIESAEKIYWHEERRALYYKYADDD